MNVSKQAPSDSLIRAKYVAGKNVIIITNVSDREIQTIIDMLSKEDTRWKN